MVDGISVTLTEMNIDQLRSNDLLEFISTHNVRTGEIGAFEEASFRGLKPRIYYSTETYPSGRIKIRGSLHTYCNGGAHNYNDFGLGELAKVRKDLFSKFGIRFENCILNGFELGINLVLPVPPKKFLRNVHLHGTKPFERGKTKGNGYYLVAEHSLYDFKLYDKGVQFQNRFQIPCCILRMEIKYKKMQNINARGIYTLADLADFGIEILKKDLLEAWNKTLFYDYTVLDKYPGLAAYKSKSIWEQLHDEDYERFRYQRNKMNRLIESHPNNLRERIDRILQDQIYLQTLIIPETDPLSTMSYSGMELPVSQGKTCPVTGLPIDMQRAGSIRLSAVGLRYYSKHHPDLFEAVTKHFIGDLNSSEKWADLITATASKIREAHRRRITREASLYPANQFSLLNFIK